MDTANRGDPAAGGQPKRTASAPNPAGGQAKRHAPSPAGARQQGAAAGAAAGASASSLATGVHQQSLAQLLAQLCERLRREPWEVDDRYQKLLIRLGSEGDTPQRMLVAGALLHALQFSFLHVRARLEDNKLLLPVITAGATLDMVLKSGSELALRTLMYSEHADADRWERLRSEACQLTDPERAHFWELLLGEGDFTSMTVLPPQRFGTHPLSLSNVSVAGAFISDNEIAFGAHQLFSAINPDPSEVRLFDPIPRTARCFRALSRRTSSASG